MQGARQFGAVFLASLGVACASTLDVRIDQQRDLAGYHTFSFLAPDSGSVHAPDADARALDASLERIIERCLRERGFVRVSERPDLNVSYALEIRRHLVRWAETPAAVSLPSLHDSPSYEIQASGQSIEQYETGHLAILISEPGSETLIWRGGFEGRLRGEIQPQLVDAVASVILHIPVSTAASRARPARGLAEPVGACTPPI